MNKPRPRNRSEFMSSFVDPYDKSQSGYEKPFSLDANPGEPEINRAYEISLKGDTDKIPRIGITDINEAVLYYFENKLQLSVEQNNTVLKVPVIYGSPERWKSVQKDGYYRDGKGKIQVPLVMFKKESLEPNRTVGNKLDGNSVNNVVMFKKGFSRRNVYDNFFALNDQKLEEEWIVGIIPDYVTIKYNCIIWTDFVEHLDEIEAAINFASNSYWGDPQRFVFRSRIESFTNTTEIEFGEDRAVKSTFNIILEGYLIPDSVNVELANLNNKFHNFTKVIFNSEVVKQIS